MNREKLQLIKRKTELLIQVADLQKELRQVRFELSHINKQNMSPETLKNLSEGAKKNKEKGKINRLAKAKALIAEYELESKGSGQSQSNTGYSHGKKV